MNSNYRNGAALSPNCLATSPALHDQPYMKVAPHQPSPPTRHQNNLLAKNERRLLKWICLRLPQWVSPDILTAFAIVSAAIVALAYWLSDFDPAWLWLAVAGYVGHWFGDSLDGSLARFRKIERPSYGYFIDHSSDGLTTFMMVGGFGLSPFVRIDVAFYGVIAYLLLNIHSFLLAKVSGDFPMSHAGMGPTEARILLIFLTVCMYFVGPVSNRFDLLSGFDAVFIILATILVILFAVQTWRSGELLKTRDKAQQD